MKYKKVTVNDLHTMADKGIYNAILYCDGCGAEFSADPNDYFMTPGEHVFKCSHGQTYSERCNTGHFMRLVVKRTILEDVG